MAGSAEVEAAVPHLDDRVSPAESRVLLMVLAGDQVVEGEGLAPGRRARSDRGAGASTVGPKEWSPPPRSAPRGAGLALPFTRGRQVKPCPTRQERAGEVVNPRRNSGGSGSGSSLVNRLRGMTGSQPADRGGLGEGPACRRANRTRQTASTAGRPLDIFAIEAAETSSPARRGRRTRRPASTSRASPRPARRSRPPPP